MTGIMLAAGPLFAADNSRAPWWESIFPYVVLDGAYAIPTGTVDGIGNLVAFPQPVPAADVYRAAPQLGVHAGLKAPGWLCELGVNVRFGWLTKSAQQLVALATSDQEFSVTCTSADFSVARSWVVTSSRKAHTDLFAGVAVGYLDVTTLYGDPGKSDTDAGTFWAAKVGLDYCLGGKAFRASGQYPLTTSGTTAPADVVLLFGLVATWE